VLLLFYVFGVLAMSSVIVIEDKPFGGRWIFSIFEMDQYPDL
jgi:hypothetical protein